MMRVLLLVCLIVSLVELDWERDGIFWMSSLASFLFILWTELLSRRKAQQLTTTAGVRKEDSVSSNASRCLPETYDQARQVETTDTILTGLEEVTLVRNNLDQSHVVWK